MGSVNNKQQILFVHQNFPGQYRYLAEYFAGQAEWEVFAVGEKSSVRNQLYKIPKNIHVLGYDMPDIVPQGISGRLQHFASHVTRADTIEKLLLRQKIKGLSPQIILVHPGWGEGLYLREIFPHARLVYFFEFFFSAVKNNIDFDPDFPKTLNQQIHYRMSNTANLLGLTVADVGVSPTAWQKQTYPKEYQDNIHVIHEGIDTDRVRPTPVDTLSLKGSFGIEVVLSGDEEIITYSVRNLEPSRGFHRFMRALPELQKVRPKAKFIIVGGDEKSYSGAHSSGKSWREIMLDEVGSALDHNRVYFIGKIPYQSLLELFSITSLHLYFTTPFVLSWSMLEAMACEAPILASSTEPVIEVINDQENGFLFDYFSKEDLVEKVNYLLESKSLCEKVAKQARKSIISCYDLKTVCLPKHLDLIEQQLL